MKYKIVLDTQAIWNGSESGLDQIFSKQISDIRVFLDEHIETKDIQLCLSKMVVEERIQQKVEQAKEIVAEVNDGLQRLKVLGYANRTLKIGKIKSTIFRRFAKFYIEKNRLEILKIPQLDTEDLFTRAIKKLKPFNDKGAGFKDTIIFLSMVADAKKVNDCEYILVSNNKKDFTEEVAEEFLSLTKKKLYIVHDIEDLKSELDKMIPLGLELKSLHFVVKEGVMRKTGTIVSELNKHLIRNEKRSFSLLGLLFLQSGSPVL